MSSHEIIKRVWGEGWLKTTYPENVLYTNISTIRRQIGHDKIVLARGWGYAWRGK